MKELKNEKMIEEIQLVKFLPSVVQSRNNSIIREKLYINASGDLEFTTEQRGIYI